MKMTAYVDGSYNSNGHIYGGGVVVLIPGHDKPLMHRVSGTDSNFARMRNVAGELLAAIEAVKLAQAVQCTELTVHYDYEGLEKWTNGAWQANKTLSRAYQTFIASARETMVIKFVKEKAHSGVEYNDLADRLAKEACKL